MDVKEFFLKEQHSDVAFIVGPESGQTWRFPAHRFIMIVASQVFERMFTGNFKEKESACVRVTDTTPIAFKFLLQYIYQQEVQLDNVQIMYQVLQVAQKYLITSLVDKCISLLIPNLDITTFLPIFHLTHEIEEDRKTELLLVCLQFLDDNITNIMKRNEFVLLDRSVIEEILDRDSLKVAETDIFRGVMHWAKHQCCRKKFEINHKFMRNVLGHALFKIRFFNMNWEELEMVLTEVDVLTLEERSNFTKRYLNQPVILKAPWDLELLNRPRNMINLLQFQFWEGVAENNPTTKDDSLYITFACDVILDKVFLYVRLDNSKLVLLRGTISDLDGVAIYNWKYKKTFDSGTENFQKIEVGISTGLNAFRCYIIRVMSFCGSLCMGGTHTVLFGRADEPRQVLLYCKSNTGNVVEEPLKNREFWRKVFIDFEWEETPEPSSLVSVFEQVNFFIVKRYKEGFINS